MESKTKEEKEIKQKQLEMRKIKREINRMSCPFFAAQGKCHHHGINGINGNYKHYEACPFKNKKYQCKYFIDRMVSLEPWGIKKEGDINFMSFLRNKNNKQEQIMRFEQ